MKKIVYLTSTFPSEKIGYAGNKTFFELLKETSQKGFEVYTFMASFDGTQQRCLKSERKLQNLGKLSSYQK